MAESFLKENILKSKQNDKSGKNALKLVRIDKKDEFLFEKNINQFVELIDFLKGDDNVLAVTGYSLCGKSLLGSVIPQIINEKTVFYVFKCTPASTIDDVLLCFFDIFRDYAQKKLVNIPKIDTQNFQERINIYLTKCENPIVILLDGLNEIKNQKNKDSIMNFISQVLNFNNIKLIITTRAFDISDLKNINLKLSTSVIKPLTINDLKEYCLKNIINSEGIEDFYDLSRGHYFNLFYAMNYIQPTNKTIKEFVAEVQSSGKSMDEIVISKNLSLIPESYDNLLWIIASSEFGMPLTNILSIPDCSEDQIKFLEKKIIIEIINGCVYVKDYYKPEILKTIEPIARINIIKGIIKFLEAQLPLKPVLRELKLSRCTLRNEIERLNGIINKSQTKKNEFNKTAYMNILGYSKQFKTNWDGFDEIIMPKDNTPIGGRTKNEEPPQQTEEVKNEPKPDAFTLPKENSSALNFAKRLKNKYAYSDALIQYADALITAKENGDNLQLFEIYKDIAECYFFLGETSNAIENYGRASEIAKKEKMENERYLILLEIAKIYTRTYRKDLASEIYNEVLSKQNIGDSIKLSAELSLFELNFADMSPNEILKKYNELLKKAKNDSVLSAKIHFRLGFLYDKGLSLENAISHYKSSIRACSDCNLNENLSSCYYNLAEIYGERKEYDTALDYYLKSYSVDEMTNKIENLILTSKKIAKIYEKKKDKMAQNYYERAVEFAKTLNDNYPLACAIIDLGDYYYRQKQDMKALKIYISVKRIMANQITSENEIAINDRINDLRVRMGSNIVNSVIREFS